MFSMRGFFLCTLVCILSQWGLSQELPEKRLTKEELQKPGVAVLVERLKSLRRNAERFGPKHPSTPSVQKQIAELESQLQVVLGAPAAVSSPKVQPDPRIVSPSTNPGVVATKSKSKPRMPGVSAWGLDPWAQWPASVRELKSQTKQISRSREAYPWLGMKDLVAAGAMPGMGLMWGIAYDEFNDQSYLYQWYDSPANQRRELYFQIEGRLLSIYFPSDFDLTGNFWFIKSSSDAIGARRAEDSPNGSSVEIIEVTADRFPPYEIKEYPGKLLGRLNLNSKEQLQIFSSQQRGLYLRGVDPAFESNKDFPSRLLRGTMLEQDFWVFDRPVGGVLEQRKIQVHRGNERSIEQLIRGEFLDRGVSYPDYGYLGINSVGELLIIDRGGRLLKSLDPGAGQPVAGDWPPRRLSQLGGYLSMVDGSLLPVFQKYEPEAFEREEREFDFKKTCVAGSFRGDLSDLTFDYWVCLPRGTAPRNTRDSRVDLPEGTLLVQTISVPSSWFAVPASTKSSVAIETRLLVLSNHEWFAFSYIWDEEQTDAVLVDNQAEIELNKLDEGTIGFWTTSRSEGCYECHHHGPIGFPSIVNHHESAKENSLQEVVSLWGRVSESQGTIAPVPRIGWDPILVRSDSLRRREYLEKGLSSTEFDWGWFKECLVKEHLELWYRNSPGSDGLFSAEFDSDWGSAPASSATLNSQSSHIYNMAKAYSVLGGTKYSDAIKQGAKFLRERFRDSDHGGYYSRVDVQARVMDRTKDGYGHAFAILALATAANATGDLQYASEAMECWEVLRTGMMQPGGGLVATSAEDFSAPRNYSLSTNVKLLEGLLELYRATKDEDVYMDVVRLIEFFTEQARDGSGAIPEEYSPKWKGLMEIDGKPNRHLGHQVQWAFLLSQAVEEGFPRKYLQAGGELMDYAIRQGYDPYVGGLVDPYEKNNVGSDQFDFLRALLRYYSRHGHQEYLDPILTTQKRLEISIIGSEDLKWPQLLDGKKRRYSEDVSRGIAMCIEGIQVGSLVQETLQGIVKVK